MLTIREMVIKNEILSFDINRFFFWRDCWLYQNSYLFSSRGSL